MSWLPSTSRPAAGEITSGTHSHADLSCRYKLYAPPQAGGHALPLVVMLHGCNQSADDFAAGTAMNQRAKDQGFYVLYPQQSQEANATGCWNWFEQANQQRDRGEPALLVGLIQWVMAQHGIDPRRVFIAGMSAGGAMATVLARCYPELFAAVGVHSGLVVGSVSGMGQALNLMNSGDTDLASLEAAAGDAPALAQGANGRSYMPTIVFHGDQDTLVHPHNGQQVVRAALGHVIHRVQTDACTSEGGRRYTQHRYFDAQDQVVGEFWLVHGTGHAWSGGSLNGSYTDRHGPDATGEMLRFFFAQVS